MLTGKKFEAEMPGILAWAVGGVQRYLRRGVEAPPQVKEAVKRYREESDVIMAFIGERCRPSRIKSWVC